MSEIRENTSNSKKTSTHNVVLVILLFTLALLLGYLSWSTSPNRTEVGHIGATIYFWNYCKFDVFSVNPPLVRIVAGIPIALFCHPKYDWNSYSPRPQDRCEWQLGNAFIAANKFDDLRLYVFLARIFCIPFVLLGGYFGYRFASELYGNMSGILFLILWTFSPLILGWGATICPDVTAASMGVVGLYAFWHWLKKPVWILAVIAGLCLGLMPLAKLTWIIAFPLWGILWIIWKIIGSKEKWQMKQFVAILLLGLYTINIGYGFDSSFRFLKDYQFISGTFTGLEVSKQMPVKPGNRFRESILGYFPVPLPADFIQGIDTQRLDFERGIESYACGVWSDHGWWWYYGSVLMLKEPLGVWCLVGLALLAMLFYRNNIAWRNEIIVILPMFLLFLFISSQNGFSIHPRYIVLVLPFLYIFISKVVLFLSSRNLIFTFLAAGFHFWIIGSSMWFYPHSMSYFNELAGRPMDYPKYLLGSNIDWGQDLYELKNWIEKHPEAKPLYISAEYAMPLKKLGIEANAVPDSAITDGWVIISVNQLFEDSKMYDWLKKKDPIGMIGYSLWIYKIEE